MDAHTVIEEWDSRPFDNGYQTIHNRCAEGFSGAIETADTWLFVEAGEPLAIISDLEDAPHPGDIETFSNATGTLYESSYPAEATLAAMLLLDGEVRGQYFTDDTSLTTVHETLTDGGFTGYIELSENVLSGDYYVIYEDGVFEYLAYLGSGNRVLSGEEAEQKAINEVGVYSVIAVEFSSIEVPESNHGTTSELSTGSSSNSTNSSVSESDTESVPTSVTDPENDTSDSSLSKPNADEPSSDLIEAQEEFKESSEASTQSEEGVGDAELEPGDDSSETVPESSTDSTESIVTSTSSEPGHNELDGDSETGETSTANEPEVESDEPSMEETSEQDPLSAVVDISDENASGSPSTNGASIGDVASHTVPSLDPTNSGSTSTTTEETSIRSPDSEQARHVDRDPDPQGPTTSATEESESTQEMSGSSDESNLSSLRSERDKLRSQRDELQSRLEELQVDHDELRDEHTELQAKRDRLQQQLDEMKSTEQRMGGTTRSSTSLSAPEALAGTSLFVREGSRGGATLEDAHAGSVDREAIEENIRIEHHTQFDDNDVTVDGQPFETFLKATTSYQFAEWLTTDLLFEIQSTGAITEMKGLYDALPRIDRVGFREGISIGSNEETYEFDFDIVVRDRMGDPLAIADLDTTRDPTGASAMGPILEDANEVATEHGGLEAAFSVTASYFEPDALEAAREATSGSLLSRDKRGSYVKLSRKTGFHLCLVESRNDDFHLTVPEL